MPRRIRGSHNYITLGIYLSIVVFLWYLKTLAPTVLWGDSARLAKSSYILELDYDPHNHPLHTLLGSLFNLIPLGDIAWRQNLMSAVFGALTVFLLYLVVFKITNSKFCSLSAGGSLALSHTFWQLSVINETYSPLAFFSVLPVLILLLWRENKRKGLLYLLFFLSGLGISNNSLILFFVPAYAAYILSFKEGRESFSKKSLFIIFVSFLSGLSVLILSVFWKGHAIHEIVRRSIANPFQCYVHINKIFQEVMRYPVYLFYQFPLVGFLLGLRGIKRLIGPDRKLLVFLLSLAFIDIIFASAYARTKQYYLMLPSYLIFAVFIGPGLNYIRNKFTQISLLVLLVCLPLLLYYNIPAILGSLNIDPVKTRSVPYRDNTRYFLVPDKSNYFGAYRYGREALAAVKPGSIIIADFTTAAVLDYFCVVEKECPVKIIFSESIDIPPFIADNIKINNIYLADTEESYYDMKRLKEKYRFVPQGPVFRVLKKND